MLRNKPLMLTAVFLGVIGAIMIIFASVLFLSGNGDVYSELADLLGMKSADVCTATVCATAVIFVFFFFLFGCSALSAETK